MTRKDKAAFRAHWPHYELQFRNDGRLWARPKGTASPFGVLLQPREVQSALAEFRRQTR